MTSDPSTLSSTLAWDFDEDKKSDIVRVCAGGFETWMLGNIHSYMFFKETPKNFGKSSWVTADTNKNGVDEIIHEYRLNPVPGDKLISTVYGDFTGDGKDDELYITDTRLLLHPKFEGSLAKTTARLARNELYLVGDFNGDKIKDVIFIPKEKPKRNKPTWRHEMKLYLGRSNGLFKRSKLNLGSCYRWFIKRYEGGFYGKWLVGDFDNNGFDDLIHFNGRNKVNYIWKIGNSSIVNDTPTPTIYSAEPVINRTNYNGNWFPGDYNGD